METFSALLAICVGNSPGTGEFPAQRPVTQSFDVFFDLRLNKRLRKQSWVSGFETLSCPLWCHCNDMIAPVPVKDTWRTRVKLTDTKPQQKQGLPYDIWKQGSFQTHDLKTNYINMYKERKMTPSIYFGGHLINFLVICAHFMCQWKPCNIGMNSMHSPQEVVQIMVNKNSVS